MCPTGDIGTVGTPSCCLQSRVALQCIMGVLTTAVLRHAGLVTTLVTAEQAQGLQGIAEELEFCLREQPEPPLDIEINLEGDMDMAKKGLDDLYNLL